MFLHSYVNPITFFIYLCNVFILYANLYDQTTLLAIWTVGIRHGLWDVNWPLNTVYVFCWRAYHFTWRLQKEVRIFNTGSIHRAQI